MDREIKMPRNSYFFSNREIKMPRKAILPKKNREIKMQ